MAGETNKETLGAPAVASIEPAGGQTVKAVIAVVREAFMDAARVAVRSLHRIDQRFATPISTTERPIFIVGCGHSGTTLLTAILNAHPNIFAVDHETRLFNSLYFRPTIERQFAQFHEAARREGKTRIVEKTPRHLYEIDRIAKYFPQARFIAMVRDGRDVACSIKKRKGALSIGINRWVKDNQELLKRLSYPNVLCIKYEDLIENLPETMHRVMAFLGEEYTPALENHTAKKYEYENVGQLQKPVDEYGKNHNNYRAWQVNQPVFDGRFKWKKGMSAIEQQQFKAIANELLLFFRYESDAQW